MLTLALLVALQVAVPADSALTIVTANATPAEVATKAQLERILARHDTRAWQFTHRVVIDAAAIPTSHPRLTLSARHLRDDELLLSTYLHEQLHWFLGQHAPEGAAAVRELKDLLPSTPVGYPDGGADETGNYYHLIVIYLEDRANRIVQGELRAAQIMSFWEGDHYRWLYRTVRERNREIGAIVRKHGLLYPARPPS